MTRIKTTDARQALREVMTEKAAEAAGSNNIISKAEAPRLQGFLKRAEEQVRTEGGRGARVSVDAVVDRAAQNAHQVWDRFNPPGRGADSKYLSMGEVAAIQRDDPALGELSKMAYLRAGRAAPTPPPVDGGVEANADAVKAFLGSFDFSDRALRNLPTLTRVDARPGMPGRSEVPATVLAGFDVYERAEQRDWATASLMKGKLGDQDVWALSFTTDGDAAAVEVYSRSGKPLVSARLSDDKLLGWDRFFGRARLEPGLMRLDDPVNEEGMSEPAERAAAGQIPVRWSGEAQLSTGTVTHKNGRLLDIEFPASFTPEQEELATAGMELAWEDVLTHRRWEEEPLQLTGQGTLSVGSFTRPTDGKTYLVADWRDIDDSSHTYYFQRDQNGALQLAIKQFNN